MKRCKKIKDQPDTCRMADEEERRGLIEPVSDRSNGHISTVSGFPGYDFLVDFAVAWSTKLVLALCLWVLTLASTILIIFRGGFSTESGQTFNFHVLFMIIAFNVIFPIGALAFRFGQGYPRIYAKSAHAFIMFICLFLFSLGYYFIYQQKESRKVGHIQTLHSWIGLFLMIGFVVQLVVGFICFVYPGVSMEMKARIKPFHVTFGRLFLFLALSTPLIGLGHHLAKVPPKGDPERIFLNVLGVSIVLCLMLTFQILSHPKS